MKEKQTIRVIEKKDLRAQVQQMSDQGWRLVQISATTLTQAQPDGYEVNYSFDKEFSFVNLRVVLPAADPAIESVSAIYWNAFLYENELHDLFGIAVSGMAIDYQGTFYRTSVKVPFGCTKLPAAGQQGGAANG